MRMKYGYEECDEFALSGRRKKETNAHAWPKFVQISC